MRNEQIWLRSKDGKVIFQANPGTIFELKYVSEDRRKITACTGSEGVYTMLVDSTEVCKKKMDDLLNAISSGYTIFDFGK